MYYNIHIQTAYWFFFFGEPWLLLKWSSQVLPALALCGAVRRTAGERGLDSNSWCSGLLRGHPVPSHWTHLPWLYCFSSPAPRAPLPTRSWRAPTAQSSWRKTMCNADGVIPSVLVLFPHELATLPYPSPFSFLKFCCVCTMRGSSSWWLRPLLDGSAFPPLLASSSLCPWDGRT